MERFSTAGLPGRRKVAFWNEVSSETFTALEMVPGDRDHFEGTLYRDIGGPVGLVDVTTAPGSLHHTRAHVARALGERFTLLVSLSGEFEYRAAGQGDVRVAAGDILMLDHARPYELRFAHCARTFCYVLPQRFLTDHLPDPELVAGRVMPPRDGGARVLGQLTRALSAELERGDAGQLAASLSRGLGAFIGAAFGAASDGARAVLRRRRVLTWVDAHLHDPGLRPATVARACGLSERTLRQLFAGGPETLMQLVLRRRLEAASRWLRDPAWRGRGVTEIALRAGFSNPTHFGHAFRLRFGRSPRDWRRGD